MISLSQYLHPQTEATADIVASHLLSRENSTPFDEFLGEREEVDDGLGNMTPIGERFWISIVNQRQERAVSRCPWRQSFFFCSFDLLVIIPFKGNKPYKIIFEN